MIVDEGEKSETIYEYLFENQPTAIKNAITLLAQYDCHSPAKDNFSTTVHLLVQELNKFVNSDTVNTANPNL